MVALLGLPTDAVAGSAMFQIPDGRIGLNLSLATVVAESGLRSNDPRKLFISKRL